MEAWKSMATDKHPAMDTNQDLWLCIIVTLDLCCCPCQPISACVEKESGKAPFQLVVKYNFLQIFRFKPSFFLTISVLANSSCSEENSLPFTHLDSKRLLRHRYRCWHPFGPACIRKGSIRAGHYRQIPLPGGVHHAHLPRPRHLQVHVQRRLVT